MKKLLILTTIVLLGLSLTGLKAQEAFTTSGGEAKGSGGTVSYTIGQILYTTDPGSNGSVAHGVQQPYEISTVTGIKEAEGITLALVAYPNPTTNMLTLQVDNYQSDNLTYRIFDLSGKLLEVGRLTGDKTTIQFGNKPTALYLLRVYDGRQEIKVFKIIKN